MRGKPGRINREGLIVLALALSLAISVFVAHLPVEGPMIQGDEGSYLANAAAIAGFHNDMASSYHAGYSFLIAPAFWLADCPAGIWTAVKAVNAFLFFVTVLTLWLLSRRLHPEASPTARLCAVALVSVYPMWVVMAGYSFSQIAFVPVFLLAVLALLRAAEGGSMAWLGLGICSGFLYWVHPVGLAVVAAAIIAGGYLAWRQRSYWGFAALLLSVLAIVLSYQYGVMPWLHNRMTISGLPPYLHYPTVARILSELLPFEVPKELVVYAAAVTLWPVLGMVALLWIGLISLGGLKEVIVYAGGHVLYLSIGTVGLLWVGLISLGRRVIRAPEGESNESIPMGRAVSVFLLLSLAGVVALSVLFHARGADMRRLDCFLYGRYAEGVIAPILLVGALGLSFRKALWAIPAALLGAVLLSPSLDAYTLVSYPNISALWQVFPLAEQGFWVWVAAGCLLIVIAAVTPRRFAMFLIAAVFAYSSFLQIGWHVEASQNAMTRCEVALTIRDEYPPGTSVGFNRPGFYGSADRRWEYWYDFGFVLFDYRLQRMSIEQWVESCDGPLLSYERYLDEKGIDAYPLAVSPHGDLVLWERGPAPPGHVDQRDTLLVRDFGRRGMASDVGGFCDGSLISTGQPGFLVFGPYVFMPAGEYSLVLTGAASSTDSAWVDVVSGQGGVQHGKFALTPTAHGETGVLASGRVFLEEAVTDLEVRVYVGADDEIRLDGYELVPADGTRDTSLRVNHFGRWDMLSQVGELSNGSLISTGQPGFLVFGPYTPMPAGEYSLVVTGAASSTGSAWVDVVSGQGRVQHGKFALTPTVEGETAVLSSGRVCLDEDVVDLEVRVYVGAADEVRLDGYELVPVDGNPVPSAGS